MRASSTTVPLTLRSWLNILLIRRFLAVFFLVVKHPTQKALFSYSHNGSTMNHHPRKQQQRHKYTLIYTYIHIYT